MDNKKKIFYLRARRNDDQLRPWDYRTYTRDYAFTFSIFSLVATVALAYLHQKLLGLSLVDLWKIVQHSSNPELVLVAKEKLYGILGTGSFVGALASWKLNKPINYSRISDKSENFYYSNPIESNIEFHKEQRQRHRIDFKNPPNNSLTLVSPEECKGKDSIFQPVQFNENASILAGLVIGIAGGGKSAFLTRLYEQILANGHKLIVHAPDSKARDMLVSSGYQCAVSAPWLKNSIYIDLASTLNVEDMNLKNELIGLVITSFFGYVDKGSSESFFQNGAVFILTASLRKLCSEHPGQWSLDDWKRELTGKEIWEFKDMVDTYFPEAGFTINEEAEKMTASIIASITETLVSIGKLSVYYKQCRKPFDLKKWCMNEDRKQVIVLCSDTQYADISRINIALFINLCIPFMLSGEREQIFNRNPQRIYQALDEFPNFARNIDTNQWIRIVNEGRKFGNSAIVIAQNTPQIVGCFTSKNAEADSRKFIGSFHTQYIAQPSSEDEKFLSSIVGEITYEDKEAQASIDQVTGKKTISYPPKLRKENVSFKQLQSDLGVVKDKSGKPLGVTVAVRLFETRITAPLFFPFVEEFAKSHRDKFRDKIIQKDGHEYIKIGQGMKRPLFVSDDRIILSQKEELEIYNLNALASKRNMLPKLLEAGKLKQAKEVESEIRLLEQQLNVSDPEGEKDDSNPVEKATSEVAIEAVDPSGMLGIGMQLGELMESLSDSPAPGGEPAGTVSTEEPKKKKLIKKDREIEL